MNRWFTDRFKKCPVCDTKLKYHIGLYGKYLCKECNVYYTKEELIKHE
jgi:hypothetical protein